MKQGPAWHEAAKRLAEDAARKDDEAVEAFTKHLRGELLPTIKDIKASELVDQFGFFANRGSHDYRMQDLYREARDALRAEILRRIPSCPA